MHTGYLQLDSCLSKVGSVHCVVLNSSTVCHPLDTNVSPPYCDNQKWFQTLTNIPWRNKPFPWNQSYLWKYEKCDSLPEVITLSQCSPRQIENASLATPVVPERRNVMRWSRGFICFSCTCNSFLLTIKSLVLRPLPQMWCLTGAMSKGLKSLSSGTVNSLWAW